MRILAAILFFVCSAANAQFVQGQILTAQQLNNAFSNVLSTSGGTLTGPLTVPALTVASALTVPSLNVTGLANFSNVGITGGTITGLSAPIPIASGGTSASTATGATSQLQYLQGSTGSVALSLTAKFQALPIDLLDFGADPTDTADSTTAFSNFNAACLMLNRPCHINGGTYKISSQVVIDLVNLGARGVYLYGDGQFASILDLTSVATSPAFLIRDTSVSGAAFYSEFRDFAIHTNLAGTALQLGKTTFSDALNEFNFEHIWVGNNSTSASAIGIQVNYVLNSHFNGVIAANNGHGDAWQINAAAFCIWAGGSGTFGDNGYHLTAGGAGTGTIGGNIFTGIDHEVNAVNDVKIDTANATVNTWIGGTFVYTPGTTFAFAASAGSDNTIVSPNTLGFPSGTPSLANFFNGSTGVSLINKFNQTTLNGQVTTGALSHSHQEIDASYFANAPTTGGTVTIGTGTETALIVPAGTLASLTVTLPACGGAGDADGSIVRYSSSQTITALTVNATSSSVSNAPTTVAAGGGAKFLCRSFNTTWYPVY